MRRQNKISHKQIIAAHHLLRDDILRKWKRVLPLNEAFGDRWEKARYLGFGKNTSIYDSSFIFGDVKVGENTWIGPFTLLDGSAGLSIGSFCSVSAGVQIYTHDSVAWAISGGKAKYAYAPVAIGDCSYIGPNAVISKGVVIGNHRIVGAGSFVNKNIPSFSAAFGIPVKVVGRVKIDRNGAVTIVYKKNKS